MIEFFQWVLSGVLLGGLYASVAAAFIVIYRSTRVFNFAQGELLMFGGFFVYAAAVTMDLPKGLSIPLAMAICAGLGLLIERLTIRPLIGQPLFSVVMVTIALMLILRSISMLIWGALPLRFPDLFGDEGVSIGPFRFSASLFYGFITVVVLIVCLWWMFGNTKRGLTMSAVAEGHDVAKSLGINVRQSMSLAWAISGLVSVIAAASWLSGRSINYLVADIGLRAIPCALLAGLESIPGALLAGVIVGVSENLCVGYLDSYTSGGMSLIVPFFIMLIVLWIRPQGLFGWKIIERL